MINKKSLLIEINNIDSTFFNNLKNLFYKDSNNEIYYERGGIYLTVSNNKDTGDINLNNDYVYNKFNFDTHYFNLSETPGNYFTAYSNFTYNYFNKTYEDHAKNLTDELMIPGLYTLKNDQMSFKNLFSNRMLWIKTPIMIDLINDKDYIEIIKRAEDLINVTPFYLNVSFNTHENKKNFLNFFRGESSFFTNLVSVIHNKNYVEKQNYKLINSNIFNFKDIATFQEMLSKNHISLKNILENKEIYNEVIGYKITKYLESETSNPIQTLYMPLLDSASMSLLDSQIFYNKKYIYIIEAIVFCIESKIKLTANPAGDTNCLNEVEPQIYLIQCSKPDFKFLLKPPLPPFVEIIPSREYNEKYGSIKFNFSLSHGESKKQKIIQIDENLENKSFQEIIKQQNATDNEISFSSHDKIKQIILYRTIKKPTSYADFSGLLEYDETSDEQNIKKTFNLEDSNTKLLFTSYSWSEKLKVNTKYYYTFKTLSFHDHYSNPDNIYEVELLEDRGNLYHLIRIYNIEEDKKQQKDSHMFKEKFLVEPEASQMLINNESTIQQYNNQTGDFKGIKLSIRPEKEVLWGRNFKVRVTSKFTGKKIDFNLTFNYKQGNN